MGDLFISLIHTCQLCEANSLNYVIEMHRDAQDLVARPAEWMPWNYGETIDSSRSMMSRAGRI